MTSKTIKTTLFALLVLSIVVPSTVFAIEPKDQVMGENMTVKSGFESWENIRGEIVLVSSTTAVKLLERGYLVGQLIVN